MKKEERGLRPRSLPSQENATNAARVNISAKFGTMWNLIRDHPSYVAALLLLVFAIQTGTACRHMASTGDELHYLGMGGYLLRERTWDVDDALLHPPLSYYLHSLPLLFVSLDYGIFKIPDANERGRRVIGSSANDRLLLLARIPILILAALLGVLIFVWGRQAYGTPAGLLALFLFAFYPSILANSVLITPDLCLCFFSTLTFYLLWRYEKAGSILTLFGLGAALGFVLLSKFSGTLVAVALVLIAGARAFQRRRGIPGDEKILKARHLALVLVVALLVVNAGYLFSDVLPSLNGVSFKSRLFQHLAEAGVFRWIPSPLPSAWVKGLDWQYTVLENGFGYFMLGQYAKEGWISYFLVAFLAKSPVPFLILLAFAIMISVRRRSMKHGAILLIPVLLFFLFFSFAKMSRGIRYILPVYPLLFLWIGQIVTQAWPQLHRKLKPVLLLLGCWYMAGTLWVAPHYLAYFNEPSGGPNNGHNLLWEADCDWGQELKALAGYLRDSGIRRVRMGIFTTADPGHYGISFDPLSCGPPGPQETGDLPIVVSATSINFDCHRWLKQFEPDVILGYTVFIYKVPLHRRVDIAGSPSTALIPE